MDLSILLAYIEWTVDPEIFTVFGRGIRWYGLLFAGGFLVGVYISQAMFEHENIPESWLEKGFIFVLLGTIVGARLGHVFFYDWDYYSQHLSEIPALWKGGLASHGAIIGIGLSIWIYSRTVTKRSIVWIMDRVVVPIPLAGAFIRFGNFFNHEIIGLEARGVSWAVYFRNNPEGLGDVPRHPVQLYEAFPYILIFGLMMYLYWRTDAKDRRGALFGWFMTLIFTVRFFTEYFKNSQGGFEEALGTFSTGQWLSIPCVITGLIFLYVAYSKPPNPWPPAPQDPPKPDKKKAKGGKATKGSAKRSAKRK